MSASVVGFRAEGASSTGRALTGAEVKVYAMLDDGTELPVRCVTHLFMSMDRKSVELRMGVFGASVALSADLAKDPDDA